jgi:hypothetical protein
MQCYEFAHGISSPIRLPARGRSCIRFWIEGWIIRGPSAGTWGNELRMTVLVAKARHWFQCAVRKTTNADLAVRVYFSIELPGLFGTTKQAAEKGSFGVEFDCSGAGAKAPFSHFKQLMARLKSCPFAHLRQGGVFPQAVKSCPRKKQDCRLNKKGSPQNSMPDPLIEQRAAPTQRVPRWGTVSSIAGRRRRWTTDTKLAPIKFLWQPETFACHDSSNAIALGQ